MICLFMDILHLKSFIDSKESKTLFTSLKNYINWQETKWGNKKLTRLVYSVGQRDIALTFLQSIINKLTLNGISYPKGIWMNLYRDGKDYTPYHKDSYDANVYVLSLGATRTLRFKKDVKGSKSIDYEINDGDLYGFTKKINNEYKHSIPKLTKKQMNDNKWNGERISIVFFV